MSANQPDEVVRMKLSCRDSAHFLAEFAPKMSSRIFVPMEAPLAAGASLILQIKFQDGEVHVKGRAEVIRPVTSPRNGVHVRFTELDADSIQFVLVRGETATTTAFVPGDVVPVPLPGLSAAPAAPKYGASADPTTPGSPIPLPGWSKSSSHATTPASPKPVSSLLSDAPPPKPSSPKPVSSLLSDAPPPKPSSPKPVSSLLVDAPPPKPSSPKPVSSLLSDAAAKPGSLLSDPRWTKPSYGVPEIFKPAAARPTPEQPTLGDALPPTQPSRALSDLAFPKQAPDVPATPLKAAPDPLALLDSAAAREAPSSESVTRVTVAPPAPQPVITPPATVRDPLAFLDEPAAVTQVSRPAPERVPAADVVARASAVSPTPQAVVAAPVAHITRVTPPVRADSPTPQAEVAVPVADITRVTPPVRADSPTPPAPAVAGIVTGVTPPAPAVSPEPRDARPLDVPAKRERPAPMISEQEAPDELPLPASSRAPLFLGLGLVLLLAVGGGLFAFAKPTPASTPTAPQTNPVVTNLLKKMDEQMMAGRYAGPGGDTALDSLQVALATAPDNARVKEYQEKLASFFERRVTEATAKSDHAEAAVALIALSLADPKRAGVKEKLLAEVDQVKNQAKTK